MVSSSSSHATMPSSPKPPQPLLIENDASRSSNPSLTPQPLLNENNTSESSNPPLTSNQPNPLKTFICKYCKKVFFGSQSFAGHHNIHKAERVLIEKQRHRADQVPVVAHNNLVTPHIRYHPYYPYTLNHGSRLTTLIPKPTQSLASNLASSSNHGLRSAFFIPKPTQSSALNIASSSHQGLGHHNNNQFDSSVRVSSQLQTPFNMERLENGLGPHNNSRSDSYVRGSQLQTPFNRVMLENSLGHHIHNQSHSSTRGSQLQTPNMVRLESLQSGRITSPITTPPLFGRRTGSGLRGQGLSRGSTSVTINLTVKINGAHRVNQQGQDPLGVNLNLEL